MTTKRVPGLESLLQGLIRDGEYGAPARAQRILQRQGPVAVLDEISRIKRNHVKRLYFEELAKSDSLDFAVKQRIIRQASEEISSDGEKAEFFEKLATHFWKRPNRARKPDPVGQHRPFRR